ncbi:hypothetical protein KLEP174_gp36 [Pseudomonas phage vB_PcuM_ KLEP17-4]|nr:hypothetical protein KLEP174_gp36 [Pseudomonas phage vB_PcuM_ KLEP17-4]
MAQSTILAAGVTAATSTDIDINNSQTVNVGIFGADGARLPRNVSFLIVMDTPDAPIPIAQIGLMSPVINLSGPGTFRVIRPAYTGAAFGVFLDGHG